jgi:hypothetical protein
MACIRKDFLTLGFSAFSHYKSLGYTIDFDPVKRLVCVYMQTVLLALVVILVVWTTVITYLLITLRSQISIFTKSGERASLPRILEGMTRDIEKAEVSVGELAKRITSLEKDGKLHIQKIGLLRFNPFKDTGGEQSFVLSLVDNEDTGIVLSGLYSRSGTRWYAKKVKHGKGLEVELSDEEQKAVALAKS